MASASAFLADPPRCVYVPVREHVGDVVNVTGALAGLRAALPDSRLIVEVGERPSGLLEGFPGIDALWVRPTHQGLAGKVRVVRRLRQEGCDAAVILDDSNTFVVLSALAGIRRRHGIWRGKKYGKLYTSKVPYRTDIPDVRGNCAALLESLGIVSLAPRLAPSPVHELEAEAFLSSLPGEGPIVGIHFGSTDPKRRLPTGLVAGLVDAIWDRNWRPLLLNTPSEAEETAQIVAACRRLPILSVRATSMLGFACVLGRLAGFIGGDSGPMHLAGVMGTPLVGLFGATLPQQAAPPVGPRQRLLQGPCACEIRTLNICSGACLVNFSASDIIEALSEVMA